MLLPRTMSTSTLTVTGRKLKEIPGWIGGQNRLVFYK